MKRKVWRGLVVATGLVAAGYLALVLRAGGEPRSQGQSAQPLPAQAEQTGNAPVGTDYFAASGGCGSAVAGEHDGEPACRELKEYLGAGGNDPACLDVLHQFIEVRHEFDQRFQQIAKTGQGIPPAEYQRLSQEYSKAQMRLLQKWWGIGPYQGQACWPVRPAAQASQFRNQMLLYAQAILQDAGRISKDMTDAMDVTKHNNVGISVALTSYLGAAGKMMGLVASEFQAAAGAATAAQQEGAILQIASDAASESGNVATQAGDAVSQAEAAGAAGMGANGGSLGYLEGSISYGGSNMPNVVQGALPTCAVLSCHRLAGLVGRNLSVFKVFDTIFEKVVPSATSKLTVQITKGGEVVLGGGGLTAAEVKTALQAIGINAEVGTGMPSLLNEVGAGRPVIAGVYSMGPNAGPLHAVVIEGIEQRAGQFGLKIYDPVGDVYWQPVSTFGKYFTGEFVWPQ